MILMKNGSTENKPVTIAFFKAPSSKGEELFSLFKERMNHYRLRGYSVIILEQTVYKMMPSILACLNYDVVIFDGSIEDDTNEQYHAAIELMKCLDHVLIVSRTPLPFNFEGMRKGGAPRTFNTGTTEYNDRMTNEEILEWIIGTLEQSSMELPRRLKLNMSEQECRKNTQIVRTIEAKMIDEASERVEQRHGVFVSYLSRYSRFYQGEQPNEPYVEDLFEVICQNSRVSMENIQYFPPGKISLEFMTEQRRFEIAHVTEKFIAGCKAFWIYETPDYDSSWWTYGERLSLVHIFNRAMNKCPNIYVVKPIKDANDHWTFDLKTYLTTEEKRKFLPQLTPAQESALNNLYINSNPDTVGYEQVEKMRMLAQMPTPLLKLHLKIEKPFLMEQMMKIVNDLALDQQEKQEALEEMTNTDRQIESIRAYGYTTKFWENHIVECPFCRAASKKAMSLENYMYSNADYFYSVSPEQYHHVKNMVSNGSAYSFQLPCGHTVSLTQSNFAYYRWWTVKSDVPTGPDGRMLEKIDVISFGR